MIITMLHARGIEGEIGINVGLNSTKNENGNKFKNPTIGLTYQDNKYVVSPRIDIDYTKVKNDHADALLKVSVNGVYEYENRTYTIPYALAGVGYESVSGGTKDVFESHPFVQAGVGVRVDLEKGFKARVETKALQILGGKDEGNEFIITAGVSMPLRDTKQRKRPVQPRPIQRVKAQPKIVYVNKNSCPIKISAPDLDRDGVRDGVDQCPGTPCNFSVDVYGCPIKTTLKINFASNSATIHRNSISKINHFADFLLKNRGSFVKIVGHTDSAGSLAHNLSLSYRRASSVMHELIARGVSAARLHAEGKGESMPITSNKTALGKAMNRRIEAELFYFKGQN